MTPFIFVIAALSVWRVTHLLVEDAIPVVKKPRDWLVARNPDGNLAYLVGCTYCTSVWVAAAHVLFLDAATGMSVLLPVFCAAAWSILAALGESVVEWLDRFGMPDA